MIGVVLADDEEPVRAALCAVLAAEPDIDVLGVTGDEAEVPGLVKGLRPDVLLLDVRMPLVEAVVGDAAAGPRVLVLTAFGNDGQVYEALRAGASGFLLKRARPVEVVAAVRTVAAGAALLFPAAVRDLLATQGPRGGDGLAAAGLTDREGDVLRGVARGLSDAEIARDLAVGVQTVTAHVGDVLAKLAARDRTQAVVRAYESGFIDPHRPPDWPMSPVR